VSGIIFHNPAARLLFQPAAGGGPDPSTALTSSVYAFRSFLA
jgi:hypothetical protein